MLNALVPELTVFDWRRSLAFYCDLIGFSIRYAREVKGFAYLELGSAELMIDQIDLGRGFHVDERLRRPLGAGLNIQLAVPDVRAVQARVLAAGLPLVLPLEERWYRRAADEIGQKQFVVADPDGYLVGPIQVVGTRPSRP
ncbi:bleomycin resistance protein [Antarcticirhabdus aurantiaca]|uniref:VOC family protein n=1 Tax=Antarcticirhabdus aurantiaca TaxID=2606717 RepID=A0ACD4NV58_9HYPH|nr:VOC family protein [Antarcticirhabdus aurantiaca]WAJ30707.1 VOC family protein [Jeongeuplla avenae]